MASDDLLKTHPHLEEFLKFLDIHNEENPRGKVLVAAGFLEQQVKEILEAFMLENKQSASLLEGFSAPLGSFGSRIKACHALGLIYDEEHHDLEVIRKIRNAFAHDMYTSFESESVVSRCETLKFKAHDYEKSDGEKVVVEPHGQFTTAATGLILNLTNRPHYVAQQRCALRAWKR